MELARRGANVTIVARNARDLANAADEIRAVVSDGESAPSNSDSKKRQQQPPFIHWLSADVTDAEQARAVVEQATRDADGQAPAFVFLAAGASKPGMFLEQSGADLEWSLRLNVVGVANVARVKWCACLVLWLVSHGTDVTSHHSPLRNK